MDSSRHGFLGKTYLLRELRVRIERVWAGIAAGFLLLTLILPQVALAAGPVISSVSYTVNEPTAANITWTTNNSSDSRVNYGTDPTPGGVANIVYSSSYVTSHLIRLEGLIPDTTYYFEVESTNPSGTSVDNNGGEYYSFTTSPPPVGYYLITLNPACGVCGEMVEAGVCGEIIEATAIVSAPGTNTYHICWDALAAWDPTKSTGAVDTFTANGAGSHISTFYMPEATKGIHKVYLADNAYAKKAEADYEVGPSVKIAPEEGPVGTAVTLNGYGFAASQQIQVKFNDTVVQTLTANDKGSWPMSYTIPDTPGGGCVFKVEAQEGAGLWVNWVTKDFEVIPKITVTPTSGKVGQPIQISGSGFGSKEKDIKVTLGEKLWEEITSAEEDGSWTVTAAVPPVQRGSHIVDASGRSTKARDVEGVEFIVDAGISVDRTLAYVGDTIAVEGGGFAPGETGVRVYFDNTVVSSSAIHVDSNGSWESSFTLPTSSYGSHTVSASGDTTSIPVTTSVNTQARIIEISPDRGAPGDLVSLTGDGFGSSKQLTVSIGGIAASDPIQTLSNGNVAVSFHVPKISTEGTLQLVVTDGEATDSDDFTVTKKTLSTTPLPISPKDSTLRSGVVTFHWQGVPSGSDFTYTYTLEISKNTTSGNIWSKSGIPESSYTLGEDEPLPNGRYYWRVKITDNYGNEGAWSDPAEFRVSTITIPTWAWVVIGLVILIVLMVVAYRETKFRVTE